ncbi:MAG: transporter permease, partial [Frankiales bacterium]|nr:transporter permease [Frankiales bacterium]
MTTRSTELRLALLQHVQLTAESVVLAILLGLPLAIAVRRSRRASEALLGLSTALYTIPSLALFALLVPITGFNAATVVIGLVLYALTILVRNILTGLDGVPAEVVEAARGLGMGPVRLLLTVELPLAVPAIVAGVRVATVSTVALVTVGALIGYGGLGNLIYEGFNNFFKAEVLTASVLCVVLAVVLDALLVLVQRLLTPWA